MASYDLVIYGGNPAGLASAVRAAREGLQVLVVEKHDHLGGLLTSGLCVWDTQYEGRRAPIYDELRTAFFDYYRDTYGEGSTQYLACLPQPKGHSNGNFEPKVAKLVIERMVAAEPNISVLRRHVPESATVENRVVRSVTFVHRDTDEPAAVTAPRFIDASYEGDLMPAAGVSYRVGRESRSEFNEPHAGRIFGRIVSDPPDGESARLGSLHRSLDLRDFPGYTEVVDADGSGTGDGRVQAYNWRTVVTDDPENRLPVTKPADYDAELYRDLELPNPANKDMPNRKQRVNRPQLLDLQHSYPDGSWEDRKRVEDTHWNALLGAMYFLQNDESIDPKRREHNRRFGLAKDEFEDNDHRPYEMYARETRRLSGRYVYTQADAMLADGTERTPIHPSSIAATEWYIDVHACSNETLPGTRHEGKIMLHQETFPGQVPYEALLPKEVDNLLVTCCVSSTHVSWSTIRLEPTWMNIGESAGWAAVLAARRGPDTTFADVDPGEVSRTSARHGVMVSFFNDLDVRDGGTQSSAAQILGTHGFFPRYDARLAEPLDAETAKIWIEAAAGIRAGRHDPQETARRLCALDAARDSDCVADRVSGHEFVQALVAAGVPVADELRRQRCGSALKRGQAAAAIVASTMAAAG